MADIFGIGSDSIYIEIAGYALFSIISLLIYRSVKYLEKRSDTKNEVMKAALKEQTEQQRKENATRDEQHLKTVILSITGIEEKILAMINGLHKRVEMTNGNVANIRYDILEVQEELDIIHDKLQPEGEVSTGAIARNLRRQREKRRDQIGKDSLTQDSKEVCHLLPSDKKPFTDSSWW